MGIISDLIESRVSLANPDEWLLGAFGGKATTAGVSVDEQTSLKFSAVWACVRVLSQTLASLPLLLYRRTDDEDKLRATDHPIYGLLHDQANTEMTSFQFRETLMAHLVTWGNGYAEIEYNGNMDPIGLWPLLPDRTWPQRVDEVLVYKTRVEHGREVTLPAWKVLHVPGLGFNGLQGYSPIQLHREAVGLGQAAAEYGARMYGNGARPSGLIEMDGGFKDAEARRNFRQEFEEYHSGLRNAGRVAVLEKGMKWQKTGIPPKDAEWVNGRKFQIREIARIFGVQPHMIGDLQDATYSNIEQQSLEFASYTMMPWLVRWEQVLNLALLRKAERGKLFTQFLMEGLVRGDLPSRYEAYSKGRQWGWLSANDVRRFENMNQVEGGDVYMVPLNMISADQVGLDAPSSEASRIALLDPAEPRELPPATARREAGEPTEARSLRARRRLQRAHLSIFEGAAERVVRREVQDLRAAAKKHLGERDTSGFLGFVESYYDEGRRDQVADLMRPSLEALAPAIYAEAAREVSGDEDMDAEADKLVRSYAKTVGTRLSLSSSGQLKAIAAETPAADLAAAVGTRLDEWSERRPAKIAKREVVTFGAAIAKRAWRTAGIQLLVWRAVGDNCPLCNAMNGRTVGIDKTFLAKGDELDPGGGTAPLRATSDHGHPPLHEGCDCMITSG